MTTNRIQPVQVTIGVGYHVGRKRAHKPNQDRVGWYVDIAPDERHLARKGLLYIVADGMGGAAKGDLASQMAVHLTLTKYYQDNELNVARSLARAIQNANKKIHERGHSDPVCWGMGTTIVAVVLHQDQFNVLNVGDSRAYLLRNGNLKLISTDHSLVQEQVRAGLLTQEEAAVHPRRNVLSRNLGYATQAHPDFASDRLRKGDILLLCSDGLWGQVSDDEMAQVLQKHEPQDAADKLVDLANERGGPDNISIIILRVDDLLIQDDDDDITDPTPLLDNTQKVQGALVDDDITDPTPLLENTEKIAVTSASIPLEIPSQSEITHVFGTTTGQNKQITTDTRVVPSNHSAPSTTVSTTSTTPDPTINQPKRIMLWILIVLLILGFIFLTMMMFNLLPENISEMINGLFAISQ